MRRLTVTLWTAGWLAAAGAQAATIELCDVGADVGALLRIPAPAGALAAQPGQAVVLTDEKGREVRAQVELAGLDGERLELVLVRPAGLGQTLRVGKIAAPETAGPYAASREGNRTVTLGDGPQPMAVYHAGIRELAAQPAFNRANFFHPLVTPAGVTVSDDAPPDHLHHRGLFLSFTEVTWSGNAQRLKGNFWHGDPAAKVAPGKVLYARGGPVCAAIAVSHDFMIGARAVLEQDVIARAARVSPRVNVLDVEYRITALGGDVVLGPNFYSCLQLRGAAAFNRPDLVFSYDDGKPHRDVDHRFDPPPEEPPLSRWIDETGLVEAKPVGAAVAIHPSTAKSRLCYSRGVKGLNLDFLYDAPLTVKAGQTLTARYQVYIHDGTAAEAQIGGIAGWFNPGIGVKWSE
ncbi:MAG: DUF6807 family protein [Thermoguttaceae bacterium]|jgi:hypothetical protein